MTLGNVPSSRLAAIQSGLLKALMGLAGLTSGAAFATGDLPGGPAVNQLNMHPPVTAIAVEQNWLHWFMLILCTVIFVVVFGVMFYSIWKHRRSVGHQAQELPEPIWVELGWTIVPFLIVIGMALPATKVLVAQKDTTNAEVTIKATGMQWQWGYDYIKGEGEGIGFISRLDPSHRVMSNAGTGPKPDDYLLKVDNPLVVPVGQKIRVITTANDVIHSWMIPAFGVKQDAIPGFVRDTWFRAERVGVSGGFEGMLGQITRSAPMSDDEGLAREEDSGQAEEAGDGRADQPFHRAPGESIRNGMSRERRRVGDRRQ